MRVKLSEKFKDEREEICNKLIEILDLDENNSFLLNDIDNDTDKQNAILDMKDDMFSSTDWFDSLSSEDKEIVDEVINKLKGKK